MTMSNVPWADDEELRNERPKLRPDLPFGQSPPPPDMQAPMGRGFSGDMSQLQSNADANANPQLGSPLSSWKESPLVARARELREKAVIAESVGDQAMARAQKRPIGVTDKMYRQLESNAKKNANPSYESPISGKGGMEFSKGEGGDCLIRDFPENEPTDAELEKRMGEGPKAKDVAKWDEEYGGHAAAAKPKKAEGKPRKDHMADVAAALARLKASKKGTKDEDPRSYGPWADNYEQGDPHPYVTSDARAKREAYELGVKAGSGHEESAKAGEAMFMRGEQTVRAPSGGFDPSRDELTENGTVEPKDTLRRRASLDPGPHSGVYVKPGDAAFTRGDGQRIVAPASGFDPRIHQIDENGEMHDRIIPEGAGEAVKAAAKTAGSLMGFQAKNPSVSAGMPSAIMARLRGKK